MLPFRETLQKVSTIILLLFLSVLIFHNNIKVSARFLFDITSPETASGVITIENTNLNQSIRHQKKLVCDDVGAHYHETMDVLCKGLGYDEAQSWSSLYRANGVTPWTEVNPDWYSVISSSDFGYDALFCSKKIGKLRVTPENFTSDCRYDTNHDCYKYTETLILYCRHRNPSLPLNSIYPPPPSAKPITWNFTLAKDSYKLLAMRSDWNSSSPNRRFSPTLMQPGGVCSANYGDPHVLDPAVTAFSYSEAFAICGAMKAPRPHRAQFLTSHFYRSVLLATGDYVSPNGRSAIWTLHCDVNETKRVFLNSSSSSEERENFFGDECLWFQNTVDTCTGNEIVLFCDGVEYRRQLSARASSSIELNKYHTNPSKQGTSLQVQIQPMGDGGRLFKENTQGVAFKDILNELNFVKKESSPASPEQLETLSNLCRLLSPFFLTLNPSINSNKSKHPSSTTTFFTPLGGGNHRASCAAVPVEFAHYSTRGSNIQYVDFACGNSSTTLKDCNVTRVDPLDSTRVYRTVELSVQGQFLNTFLNNETSHVELYPIDYSSLLSTDDNEGNNNNNNNNNNHKSDLLPKQEVCLSYPYNSLTDKVIHICRWARNDTAPPTKFASDSSRHVWWDGHAPIRQRKTVNGSFQSLECSTAAGDTDLSDCSFRYTEQPCINSMYLTCDGLTLAPITTFHPKIQNQYPQLYIRDISNMKYFPLTGIINVDTAVVLCKLRGYSRATSRTVKTFYQTVTRQNAFSEDDAFIIKDVICSEKTEYAVKYNYYKSNISGARDEIHSFAYNCDYKFETLYGIQNTFYSKVFSNCGVEKDDLWNFTFVDSPLPFDDDDSSSSTSTSSTAISGSRLNSYDIVIAESQISTPAYKNHFKSNYTLKGTILYGSSSSFSPAAARVICRTSEKFTFANRVRYYPIHSTNEVAEQYPIAISQMMCPPNALFTDDCTQIEQRRDAYTQFFDSVTAVKCDAPIRGLLFSVDVETGVVLVKYRDDGELETTATTTANNSFSSEQQQQRTPLNPTEDHVGRTPSSQIPQKFKDSFHPATCSQITHSTAIAMCRMMIVQKYPQEEDHLEFLQNIDANSTLQSQVFFWYQHKWAAPKFASQPENYSVALSQIYCDSRTMDSSDCTYQYRAANTGECFHWLSLQCGEYINSVLDGRVKNHHHNDNQQHEEEQQTQEIAVDFEFYNQSIPFLVIPYVYNVHPSSIYSGKLMITTFGGEAGEFGMVGTGELNSMIALCNDAGFYASTSVSIVDGSTNNSTSASSDFSPPTSEVIGSSANNRPVLVNAVHCPNVTGADVEVNVTVSSSSSSSNNNSPSVPTTTSSVPPVSCSSSINNNASSLTTTVSIPLSKFLSVFQNQTDLSCFSLKDIQAIFPELAPSSTSPLVNIYNITTSGLRDALSSLLSSSSANITTKQIQEQNLMRNNKCTFDYVGSPHIQQVLPFRTIECSNPHLRAPWKVRINQQLGNVVEVLSPGLKDIPENERFWSQIAYDYYPERKDLNALTMCRSVGSNRVVQYGSAKQSRNIAICFLSCDESSTDLHTCVKLENRCQNVNRELVYSVVCSFDPGDRWDNSDPSRPHSGYTLSPNSATVMSTTAPGGTPPPRITTNHPGQVTSSSSPENTTTPTNSTSYSPTTTSLTNNSNSDQGSGNSGVNTDNEEIDTAPSLALIIVLVGILGTLILFAVATCYRVRQAQQEQKEEHRNTVDVTGGNSGMSAALILSATQDHVDFSRFNTTTTSSSNHHQNNSSSPTRKDGDDNDVNVDQELSAIVNGASSSSQVNVREFHRDSGGGADDDDNETNEIYKALLASSSSPVSASSQAVAEDTGSTKEENEHDDDDHHQHLQDRVQQPLSNLAELL